MCSEVAGCMPESLCQCVLLLSVVVVVCVQVSGLQQGRQEQEAEEKEGREERRRLQVQLGHLQAQLQSATSQLQQSRERYCVLTSHQSLSLSSCYICVYLACTERLSTREPQLNSLRRQDR